jgi:hypothetical protein
MKTTRITLEIPEDALERLRVLGEPARILATLAHRAQQGVFWPSCWERPWLVQVFGDEWTARLHQESQRKERGT